MGYFRTGFNLAADFFRPEQKVSFAESLRFARDSMHVAAGLAIAGGVAIELMDERPQAHGLATLALGVAVLAEMGAAINNADLNHQLARVHTSV